MFSENHRKNRPRSGSDNHHSRLGFRGCVADRDDLGHYPFDRRNRSHRHRRRSREVAETPPQDSCVRAMAIRRTVGSCPRLDAVCRDEGAEAVLLFLKSKKLACSPRQVSKRSSTIICRGAFRLNIL